MVSLLVRSAIYFVLFSVLRLIVIPKYKGVFQKPVRINRVKARKYILLYVLSSLATIFLITSVIHLIIVGGLSILYLTPYDINLELHNYLYNFSSPLLIFLILIYWILVSIVIVVSYIHASKELRNSFKFTLDKEFKKLELAWRKKLCSEDVSSENSIHINERLVELQDYIHELTSSRSFKQFDDKNSEIIKQKILWIQQHAEVYDFIDLRIISQTVANPNYSNSLVKLWHRISKGWNINYGKNSKVIASVCLLLLLPVLVLIRWDNIQSSVASILFEQYISERQREHIESRELLLNSNQLSHIREDYQTQLGVIEQSGVDEALQFRLRSGLVREGILEMLVASSPTDLSLLTSEYVLDDADLLDTSLEEFPASLDINSEQFVYLENAQKLIEGNVENSLRYYEQEPIFQNQNYFNSIHEFFQVSDPAMFSNKNSFEQLLLIGGSLMAYKNLFPPQAGGGGITPLGNLAANLSSNGYIGKVNVNANFIRARSFGGLRGFGKVGGVLIGDLPEGEDGLDITDFEWEISEGMIHFTLIDSDGNKYITEKSPISIASYALNYAADERPTATTMTSAPPMPQLKILLHPALVDTPMGYRAIELDRFVDTYTSSWRPRLEAGYTICNIDALYDFVWQTRMVLLIDHLNTQEQNIPQEVFEETFEGEPFCDPNLGYEERDKLSDPEYSIIEAKKGQFYDEGLVNLITQVASDTNSFDEFERQIENEINGTILTESYTDSWFYPPPEYEIISGVREKEYSLNSYEFLPLENSFGEEIPLHFMLQAFFTTPKYYEGCNATVEDVKEVERCFDIDPWELPWLYDDIHAETLSNISTNTEHVQILDDMVTFTYLQRLFRLAFNEKLGSNFPLEKLLNLSEEFGTQFDGSFYRTLKWNVAPYDYSFGFERDLRFQLGIWMDVLQVNQKVSLPPLD